MGPLPPAWTHWARWWPGCNRRPFKTGGDLLRCLSALRLGYARSAERVCQCIVALVAGEFINRPFVFRHGKLGHPGLIPGLGIFDRESIQDRILVDPCEAFHHV